MFSIGPSESYALGAWELFGGKFVEINTNESTTTHLLADFTISQKSIIRGKLLHAVGDSLVIECFVNDRPKLLMINCWSIHSMCELDRNGTIADLYHNEDKRKRL
jgi:hypothetical protein